jgi:predicted nucleic acid-binding protein
MRADKIFIDSNVLLYAFDARDVKKRMRAQEWLDALWESGTGRLSWQVLNEFYVNAARKAKVNEREAQDVVRLYSVWQPISTHFAIIERAWFWQDKAQTSFWDALILASAEVLDCRCLLSEDFQSGRKFNTLTIVNPFTESPG